MAGTGAAVAMTGRLPSSYAAVCVAVLCNRRYAGHCDVKAAPLRGARNIVWLLVAVQNCIIADRLWQACGSDRHCSEEQWRCQ
jgi:hypothetical protein